MKQTQNVIIVGSGGFAKELYQYLQDSDVKLLGFIDKEPKPFYQLSYLGTEENFDDNLISQAKFLLGVGDMALRIKIISTLKKRKVNFYTFIHQSAIVAKDAIIGQGCVLCPHTTINANTRLDDFVLCNIYSSIAHDCFVGENSVLCPYVTLNGNVTIGKNCFLATRATCLPKSSLGDNSKIGAVAVISKKHPENSLIMASYRNLFLKGSNAT